MRPERGGHSISNRLLVTVPASASPSTAHAVTTLPPGCFTSPSATGSAPAPPCRAALAAWLLPPAQRPRPRPRRVLAQLLGDPAQRGGQRVAPLVVPAFGDRPGSGALALPVRSARVNQHQLPRPVRPPV